MEKVETEFDLPAKKSMRTRIATIEWRRFFRMHPQLRRTLGMVGISATTTVVVIVLVGVIGWTQRERIAMLLISTLPPAASSVYDTEGDLPKKPETTAGGTTTSKDLTVTEVVAKVNPSVVSIEVSQKNSMFSRTVGKGTGFFVSSDGYVITNRHVVDFASAIYSVTSSGGKKYSATLLAEDPYTNLAVLRVQGSGFPAVSLGNSDNLALGQSVVAIGFALGEFQNTISTGIISGLSRSIVAGGNGSSEQLDRVIQTDAAINPGNSGGPLINMRGEVVGVNVAVAQGSQNISFAIPVKDVTQVVDSVKTYGTIVRPYVGISYVQLSASAQRQFGLSVDYGVLVNAVLPGTPAAAAGIVSGDIILSIDGTKLDGEPSFAGIIRTKNVGRQISMVLLRKGVQSTVIVTLAKAPDL